MKKRLMSLLCFILLVFVSLPGKTEAAENQDYFDIIENRDTAKGDQIALSNEKLPRVVDLANLLSGGEETDLEQRLFTIRDEWDFDLVIVTTNTLNGLSPMAFSDDFFDYVGYGLGEDRSGALLLISMEANDWWISTRGYGITAFTDAGIQYIGEKMVSELHEGDFYLAFRHFSEYADDFLKQAETGKPYDTGNLPKDNLVIVGFSLAIAVAGAFIVLAIMKAKLTSVHTGTEASNYVVKNSIVMGVERDTFLYKNVTKIKKQSSSGGGGSSTHSSSSGASHGGGGGKF